MEAPLDLEALGLSLYSLLLNPALPAPHSDAHDHQHVKLLVHHFRMTHRQEQKRCHVANQSLFHHSADEYAHS